MAKRHELGDWDDLRILLAVARAGSSTAAAAQLRIVQSTVGRRIADLEDRIGTKIFDRHGKGMRLTPRGLDLVAEAQRMEQIAQRIERQLMGSDSSLVGNVRLTCTDGFASYWVVPRLAGFCQRYPDIHVQLLTSGSWLDLSIREADVAIRFAEPTDPGVVRSKVGRLRFALYASPDYLAAAGVPSTIEDLANHRLVENTTVRPIGGRSIWKEILAVNRRPTIASSSFVTVVSAVRAGAGISMLPDIYEDAEPSLVRLDIPIQAESEIWLMSHSETNENAKVRALLDYLREALNADGRLR